MGYSSGAAVAAAAADGAATSGELGWKPESAPCDIDASLMLADPPKSYNGIRVEFPFKTPMHPQEQVIFKFAVDGRPVQVARNSSSTETEQNSTK